MGVDKTNRDWLVYGFRGKKRCKKIYILRMLHAIDSNKKQKYVGIGRASISHDNYCLSMLVAFVQDHFMIHIVNKIVVLHRCGKSTSKLDSHDDRITREQTIR